MITATTNDVKYILTLGLFLYIPKMTADAGTEISIIIPIYANIVCVWPLEVIAPISPIIINSPKVIKEPILAFLEEGNPSLKIPALKKIIPINNVKRETACIPSRNVFAIPDRETSTPTIPKEVNPMPGVNKSQSAMLHGLKIFAIILTFSTTLNE
jgi:hypothetical protein